MTTPLCWRAPRRWRPARWRRSQAAGRAGAAEHDWSGPRRGGGAAGRRAGLGGGAQLRHRHRCGRRAGRRTRDRAGRPRGARERPAAGRAHPRRPPRLAGAPGGRSRGPGGARERLPAVRRPAHGLRGLGRRPVPPRDGPGRRAGRVLRRHPAGRAAGAGGAALPDRDGQHAAPAGAAGRGRFPARVPLRGRLAGAPDDAEGAVPGGRAQRHPPPTRCSSATPSGPPTSPPATTWPATRCPATASPTCPSTASAWRS